jgi:hypothetical protein
VVELIISAKNMLKNKDVLEGPMALARCILPRGTGYYLNLNNESYKEKIHAIIQKIA